MGCVYVYISCIVFAMESSIVRYEFGEEKQFYYEFKFHNYLVAGNDDVITTVILLSTNIRRGQCPLVDSYVDDFIQFMAKLCIEHNANYDAFHNYLVPHTFDESAKIANRINATIQSMKSAS